MMTMTQEYILCAAIKRKTPKDCRPYDPDKNDICKIEIGYRHHDIIQRFKGELDLDEQGFYTSKGRYVGREEARQIALTCGQIDKSEYGRQLYSEDIY